MDLQPLIEFLTQWAYAPAIVVIGVLVRWLRTSGVIDLDKFQWTLAVLLGLLFAIGQRLLLPLLDIPPIQYDWGRVILMGLATGFLTVLGHSLGKNSLQGIRLIKKKGK